MGSAAPRQKGGAKKLMDVQLNRNRRTNQAPIWTPSTSQSEEQSIYVPTLGAKAVPVPQESEPMFEVFTFKSMELLPRLKWVIRGILLERTISIISADSGGFKSFFALDAALCIATGTPFHGREVQQGAVVYVAPEGFYTLLERAIAWAQGRGIELPENFHILRVPVNIADPKVRAEFISTIEGFNPSIIIFDTLSQNAQGLNENSNDEMALWLGGGIELGHKIGAHVCIIHHNSKGTGLYRGAGAIKANADTHITLERPENDNHNTVFIRCAKQRGKPFEPFALRGDEVEIEGMVDEYDDPVTSLVFVPCSETIPQKSVSGGKQKPNKIQIRMMEVFDRLTKQYPNGVLIGRWFGECVKPDDPDNSICSNGTFYDHRKKLEEEKVIEECGDYNGKPLYLRTPITPSSPSWSAYSTDTKRSEVTPLHSNNPLGVGVVGVDTRCVGEEGDLV
ncbi:hypothetical protein IAD21_01217 [Abditibacteriota bacterium]|nr:hypothetical protein IAD21_01217 [Abditibacteriota bacterium]